MVLSEEILKAKYRKKAFSTFEVEKGTLLTPSAKQFIADKRIDLIVLESRKEVSGKIKSDKNLSSYEEGLPVQEEISESSEYIGLNGEIYKEKPNYMTQTEGNILILKSSKRIIFKAKLEYFLSELLLTTKELEISKGNKKLLENMEALIKFVNDILISESLNKILETRNLLGGKTLDMIKEMASNPKELLGTPHLLELSLKNDINLHRLNKLRALARELETHAVSYFVREDGIHREDLLQALNALSSAIYILMLKLENGEYKN